MECESLLYRAETFQFVRNLMVTLKILINLCLIKWPLAYQLLSAFANCQVKKFKIMLQRCRQLTFLRKVL